MKVVQVKYSFISALAIFIFQCGFIAPTVLAQPDSLRQAVRHQIYVSPEKCLRMIDSLQAAEVFSEGEAALEKTIVYDFLEETRLALLYAQRAQRDHLLMENPSLSMQVLDFMIIENMELSDYESAMKYTLQYLNMVSVSSDPQKLARGYYYYGSILWRMNNQKEGAEYFRKCFDSIDDSENPRILADLSFYYGEYASFLGNENKYPSAIDILLTREKLLKKMEPMKGIPEGYIDQQYGYLYSKLAYFYSINGNRGEAERCYGMFSQTSFSKTPQGISYSLPYLNNAGFYQKSIEACKKIIEKEDTASMGWTIVVGHLAEAYRGAGQYKEAASLYKSINDVIWDLKKKENASLVTEMATIHGITERDHEISLQKETIKYQHRRMILLLIIVSVLIAFVFYIVRSLNVLHKKNRKLYEQIKNSEARNPLVPVPRTLTKSDTDSQSQQYAAFDESLSQIISGKLFTNPDFDRKMMAQKMGTNENYLYSYIKDIADMPVASYITKLRLDYSITLLTSKDNGKMTIEAIAYDCGFGNIRTFQRLFKSRYGITPKEFLMFHSQNGEKD